MTTAEISNPHGEVLRERWLADLSMLAVAAIWGLNMPIMKFALTRVDAYLFNAMRLVVSAIVLGSIVLYRRDSIVNRRPEARSIESQVTMILLFAFFIGFAYQILFLMGIDRTSAGNTALIMSALPMWTASLAFFLIKERLSRVEWIGLLLAVVGTIIVTLTVPGSGPVGAAASGSMAGNLLVSAATFAWALGCVLSRPIMKEVSPIGLAFCGVAIAAPMHLWVARHAWSELPAFWTDGWLIACLLFSGGFSTGLAYAFWNYGVKILGTSHAAVFQNLVPFVALVASWFLIGEVPVLLQFVGGTVIIAGLVVMRRNRIVN